ncbi:MAG: NYN domain-containing protein [Candidatus Omnitrophota bacterium]
MSLMYIIDGYNLTSHTRFPRINNNKDSRRALLTLIKTRRLAGSLRNKVTVVFDGYPGLSSKDLGGFGIDVIFSQKETADARIKRMVEAQGNPRNVVVVSDDKEIKFFIKAVGARSIGVEDFLYPDRHKQKPQENEKDLFKPELSYSQMDKINQELKTIWLHSR